MKQELESLIEFSQSNGRVCPKPQKWNDLWEMLPEKQRVGHGWEPPLPLILAVWWEASPSSKRQRLREHILYAYEKGILEKIDKFLRGLSEDDWFHEDD